MRLAAAFSLLCAAAAAVPDALPPLIPDTSPPPAAGEPPVAASGPLRRPAPGDLRLPVPPTCISSPFGPRRAVGPRAALMHNGIDLPAPAGTWVTAAAAGEVVAVRRIGSSGLEVDVAHSGGFVTRYAHLGMVAPVLAAGQRRVAAGERIGRVGRTGVTYGTHLHFEVRIGGQPIDPAPVVAVQPC